MNTTNIPARRRAIRWKSDPLKAYKVAGGARVVYAVKPVDPEMREWITEKEIEAAAEKCASLNS